MAVELYDDFDRSNRNLDSDDACSGGQGVWKQSALEAGPATIVSNEARFNSADASYLDLDTPYEVGRTEFTVGTTVGNGTHHIGVCHVDGASRDTLQMVTDATPYIDVWELQSGTPTLRGSGGIAVSAGSKVAIEVTESGKYYTQIDATGSGGWVDDIGSSGSPDDAATQSGDILVRGNSATPGNIDDLYGQQAGAPPGTILPHMMQYTGG